MTVNKSNYDEAEERLFEAGVPSYLDAMVALREFQNIVSQKCRTVLTSRLPKFAQAIGLDLRLDEIGDWINPPERSMKGWDGLWAQLTVYIALPGYGDAYFGLQWEAGEEPYVMAYIQFLNRELFDRASRSLRGISLRGTSSRIHEDARWRDVMLYEPIRADQLRDFEAILTRVIDEWSRVWQDIGGLSALNSA